MAPRRAVRLLCAAMRGALFAACLGLAVPAQADTVAGAGFRGETDIYAHCILGDCLEWSTLEIVGRAPNGDLTSRQFPAGAGFVFEDTAVRFWDVTGDGQFEVVVVLTSLTQGAALSVYSAQGQITKTDHIGRSNRWLAPVAAADFDRDGRIEVAFVDRPHLAKTLRIFEWDGTQLVLDAEIGGLTNHRIGEDFISSGLRDCGAGPEMVLANADWSQVMVVTGRWDARPLGPWSAQALAAALDCRL